MNETIIINDNEISQDFLIQKDYTRWKKNVPVLYDTVFTEELTWPSLTVEWLPDIARRDESAGLSCQRLVLGTQSEDDKNQLLIVTVILPDDFKTFESKHYDGEKDEFGGYGLLTGHIDVSIRINHDGCVNRARSLPQCPNVIATKTESGDIFLFDYTRHPSKPDQGGKCKPDMILKGHTMEGFGISWCIQQAGLLLSSSGDGSVQLWDVNDTAEDNVDGKILNSKAQYYGHEGSVEDVGWHKFSTQLFASVGVDKHLVIWDRRQSKPVVRVKAHEDECICLDFSPFLEHVMATGCEDGSIGLWDLRHMGAAEKYLRGHNNAVTQVQWSPHRDTLLASSSNDRRVHIWDLKKGDFSGTEEKVSSELAFIHAGHCAKTVDLNWNANVSLMLASVSYDNILQIWKPSNIS